MTSFHCIDQSPVEYRRQWIGLLTVPNQEQKAANWLTRISWKSPTEVYWPKTIQRVPGKIQPNGCRGQVHRPRSIFPGMLFASIAVDNIPGYSPFSDFKATLGIRGYLRNGQGEPARITHADICEITRIERDENSPPEIVKPHEFKVGDKVRIITNLVNAPGTIARVNGDGSLSIDADGVFGLAAMRFVLGPHQVEAV